MQTIIVLLNPGQLQNPDLDLRYLVPDRIEEVSASLIKDNGYDYIDAEEGQPGPLLGIWLETENAAQNWYPLHLLWMSESTEFPRAHSAFGNSFTLCGSISC